MWFLIAVIVCVIAAPKLCSAKESNSLHATQIKISHIKSFIFNYGVNNVTFWGVQNEVLIKQGDKAASAVTHSPNTVVLADEGTPYGSDQGMYFIFSNRTKRTLAVSFDNHIGFADNTGYIMSFVGAHGQDLASDVHFFNGIWNGHCQTFAVYAETITDEDTSISKTTINLFNFNSGLLFADGGSNVPPSFSLLEKYESSNPNSDPEIVIAQEFSIPLPHGYYEETTPDYPHAGALAGVLSKQLSLPVENQNNTYLDPSDAGKTCD